MKKLKVLLVVCVMLGVGTIASAQLGPLGVGVLVGCFVERSVSAARARTELIRKIKEEGTQTAIRYDVYGTYIPLGRCSHGEGILSFRVRAEDCAKAVSPIGWQYQEGNSSYILLNRSDWDQLYAKCMPSHTKLRFEIVTLHQELRTKDHTYQKDVNYLFDHEHYTVDGNKYTLIIL